MFKFWKRKRMSFGQAKKELEKLADGRFHRIQYEIIETQYGELIQKCEVYIDGLNLYNGKTWRIALDKLESAMTGISLPVKIEDIPEMEIENED